MTRSWFIALALAASLHAGAAIALRSAHVTSSPSPLDRGLFVMEWAEDFASSPAATVVHVAHEVEHEQAPHAAIDDFNPIRRVRSQLAAIHLPALRPRLMAVTTQIARASEQGDALGRMANSRLAAIPSAVAAASRAADQAETIALSGGVELARVRAAAALAGRAFPENRPASTSAMLQDAITATGSSVHATANPPCVPSAAPRGPVPASGNKPPVYPAQAAQRRIEGTVGLWVQVSAEGRPTSARIVSTSGFKPLDDAAVSTVLGWRFEPATNEFGRTVECEATTSIVFRLR